MMNKDMLHRMKIAGEYQRKAIRALFSEEMGEHLDVIEKELKIMVTEAAAELLKEYNKSDAYREKQSHEQTSKAKKVDIV